MGGERRRRKGSASSCKKGEERSQNQPLPGSAQGNGHKLPAREIPLVCLEKKKDQDWLSTGTNYPERL